MLLILAVNYRTPDQVISQIQSLKQLKYDFKYVCIDNSPIDSHLEKFFHRCNKKNFHYIKNSNNIGYFPAAFKYLRENKNKDFKFLIICNADIEFLSMDGLIEVDKKLDNVGIISPSIFANGSNQNPYLIRRPEKSFFLKWKFIYKNLYFCRVVYFLIRLKQKLFKKNHNLQVPSEIYATQGSIFIVTKSFFETKFFNCEIPMLFAEEVLMAEKCKQNNLKTFFYPSLKVIHNEHASMGSNISKFKFEKTNQALSFILKNFYK